MTVTAIKPQDAGPLGAYRSHLAAVEKTWAEPVSALTPQDLVSYAVVFGSALLAGYVAGRILGVALIPVRK